MPYLSSLALILLTTLLMSHIASRIGIPAVVGQLLAGLVLGPAFLHWISPNATTSLFAEIGVIILMFIAGLESDLDRLKRYIKPSVLVAVIGVTVPTLVIYAFAVYWGFGFVPALFVAITFAATSVSISVAVLRELEALDSVGGTTILGAAVVDDILTVLILSFAVSLFGEGAEQSLPIGWIIVEQLAFFVGIYFLVKWIAPFLMHLAERLLPSNSVMITSLLLCIGLAWVADALGMSAVIGSFFAGVAVSQTPYRAEVDTSISTLGYGIFIPVFFVSIGLNMQLSGIWKDAGFIVILTFLAIVTKYYGSQLGARLAGLEKAPAKLVGAGMVSRGEMALIVAEVGFSAGLMARDYYASIVLAIILTTLIAPFMLKRALIDD